MERANDTASAPTLLRLQLVFALFAGVLSVPLDLLGQWLAGMAPPAAVPYTQFHIFSAAVFALITFAAWRWIVPRLGGTIVLRILTEAMLGLTLFTLGLVAAFALFVHLTPVSPAILARFARAPMTGDLIVIGGATLYLILGGLSLESASREQRRLRELARSARLDALRSQLNHHFLFNSLNVIAEAAAVQPPRAERLILQLAGVLRYSLGAGRARLVPLSAELAAVASYLELERARSGDRIEVRTDIEANLDEIHVPPLLIQPLVENAVEHGLLNGTCAGTITIAAWRKDDTLFIRVADDGAGFEPRRMAHGRERGVGLANLRDRLRAFYADRAALTLHSQAGGGGTTAEISLELTERADEPRPRPGLVRRGFFGFAGGVTAVIVMAALTLGHAGPVWALLAAQAVEIVWLLIASAAEETRTLDAAIVAFLLIGQSALMLNRLDLFTLYAGACLFGCLAAVALIPQIFGEPFTAWWMRRAYPQWLQKSPSFFRIANHLAALWGAGFLIVAVFALRNPAEPLAIAILALALGGVLMPLSALYPDFYIRHVGLRALTAETFILGLPYRYRRETAAQSTLAAQFVVSGAEPGSYYVEIGDRRCRSGQGSLRDPALTIYCGTESLRAVARGEIGPVQAIAEGLLRFRGAPEDFVRFFRCFRMATDADLRFLTGQRTIRSGTASRVA